LDFGLGIWDCRNKENKATPLDNGSRIKRGKRTRSTRKACSGSTEGRNAVFLFDLWGIRGRILVQQGVGSKLKVKRENAKLWKAAKAGRFNFGGPGEITPMR
jgi:hypothetical protein